MARNTTDTATQFCWRCFTAGDLRPRISTTSCYPWAEPGASAPAEFVSDPKIPSSKPRLLPQEDQKLSALLQCLRQACGHTLGRALGLDQAAETPAFFLKEHCACKQAMTLYVLRVLCVLSLCVRRNTKPMAPATGRLVCQCCHPLVGRHLHRSGLGMPLVGVPFNCPSSSWHAPLP